MSTKKIMAYTEETRIALLEQSIGHINETLLDIKDELKLMREEMRTGFDSLRTQLSTKIDSHFKWNIGLIFGLYATALATLIGAVGKAYHWF